MKKRLLPLLLVLALCLTLFPVSAFAADSDFVINSDGVLVKYQGYDGDVVIPNGVTSIGRSAFNGCTGLTSVTIPDSVTSIGMSAFNGCTGLTSVTIPSSVTSIDGWAFFRCEGLTSVTIPNGVTSIGDYAFYECSNLTSVTIPASVTSIGKYVFTLTPWLKAQEAQGDWFIVNGILVAYQGSGGNVVVPSGVTRIGGSAFFNCWSLTSVTIPDSVTSIGDSAFQFCDNLTGVTIPDSVTSIGAYAFNHCGSLTNVTLGSGVKHINAYTFAECANLTSINVSSDVTVEKFAFYETKFEMLEGTEADGKLTGVGMFALLPSERPSIAPETTDAVRHWNVTEYDEVDAQTAEATAKEIVELTERLTSGKKTETEKARAIFDWVVKNISYDTTAFDYITEQERGGTLTEKQGMRATQAENACYTFYYRRGVCGGYTALANRMLTLAGLPAAYITGELQNMLHAWSAVYADGQWILFDATNDWWDCSPNLHTTTERITWRDGFFRMEILWTGQVGCGISRNYAYPAHVTIPSSVNALSSSAFAYCTDLTSVDIPDSVTVIGNGAFRGCTGLPSIDLPDSVTEIGPNAFAGCTGLTNMTIPEGVTEIVQYMFSGCTALTSIDIPDGVTAIGSSAFKGCTALTSVIIPGSVTSLEGHAFENCTALTSVTIQDGVTSIEAGMFWGCSSLTSAAIPASVTSVGQAAFYNCPNVTDVYYGGSEEQWNAIQIDMFNSPLARGSTTRANIHYNSPMPQQPNQPEKPAEMTFTDVPDYFMESVSWAVEKKITNGFDDTTFGSNVRCIQAQILTFLWRAKGSPEPTIADPFDNLGDPKYYVKPAIWAYEQGLISGGSFDPDRVCTRGDVVTYLWKLAGSPKTGAAGQFTDVPAQLADAVAWAAEQGITQGIGGGLFGTNDSCTRGQIVTFLYRAYAG